MKDLWPGGISAAVKWMNSSRNRMLPRTTTHKTNASFRTHRLLPYLSPWHANWLFGIRSITGTWSVHGHSWFRLAWRSALQSGVVNFDVANTAQTGAVAAVGRCCVRHSQQSQAGWRRTYHSMSMPPITLSLKRWRFHPLRGYVPPPRQNLDASDATCLHAL